MVAQVIDPEMIVLNKGSDDGFKYGQRFLIYSVGSEITDPESGTSLGKLEIVRGTGRVVHIQNSMCTVQSDMKTSPLKTIRKTSGGTSWAAIMGGITGEIVEEQLPSVAIPFDKVARGDLAKPI